MSANSRLEKLRALVRRMPKPTAPGSPRDPRMLTTIGRRALVTSLGEKMLRGELGRAPTAAELSSWMWSEAFYEDFARLAESDGRPDLAASWRATGTRAREQAIPWEEKLARDLETEDPGRAARLRARVATRAAEATAHEAGRSN